MNRISNIFALVAVAAMITFALVAAIPFAHYGAWTVGVLYGLGIIAAGFLTLAAVASMGEIWDRSSSQ